MTSRSPCNILLSILVAALLRSTFICLFLSEVETFYFFSRNPLKGEETMKEFVIVAVLLCLSNLASAKKGNKFMFRVLIMAARRKKEKLAANFRSHNKYNL